MAGWKVEVSGLREIYDALGEMDKKAQRRINQAITDAGKKIAANAAALTPDNPVSNWGAWTQAGRGRDLSFQPAAVAAGFKVSRNNFRRRGVSAGIAWDVVQSNPGGNIFEVMGSGRRVSTRAGAHLVRTVSERFPSRSPRNLFRAYYSVMTPELRDEIRDSIIEEARKAGLR